MNEIGTYKVFHKASNEDVLTYLHEQGSAYREFTKQEYRKEMDPCLNAGVYPDTKEVYFDASTGFKDFLDDQVLPSFIDSVEEKSGAQYLIMAGFLRSSFQSNVSSYSNSRPLLLSDFNTARRGLPGDKVLTQEENDARIAMNDHVFEELKDSLGKFKDRFPQAVIELEEESLGKFFLRVTHEENKLDGLLLWEISSSVLGNLERDKENVSAILEGPHLYPTEVDKLRAPLANSEEPAHRQPKKLDL